MTGKLKTRGRMVLATKLNDVLKVRAASFEYSSCGLLTGGDRQQSLRRQSSEPLTRHATSYAVYTFGFCEDISFT